MQFSSILFIYFICLFGQHYKIYNCGTFKVTKQNGMTKYIHAMNTKQQCSVAQLYQGMKASCPLPLTLYQGMRASYPLPLTLYQGMRASYPLPLTLYQGMRASPSTANDIPGHDGTIPCTANDKPNDLQRCLVIPGHEGHTLYR